MLSANLQVKPNEVRRIDAYVDNSSKNESDYLEHMLGASIVDEQNTCDWQFVGA
jgi:hypothetical protein